MDEVETAAHYRPGFEDCLRHIHQAARVQSPVGADARAVRLRVLACLAPGGFYVQPWCKFIRRCL